MKSLAASHASFTTLASTAFAGLVFTSAHAIVLPRGDKAPASDSATTAPQFQYQKAAPAPIADASIVNHASAASAGPTMESNTGLAVESQLMEKEVSFFQSVSSATASGAYSPGGASASTLTSVPEMNMLFPIVGLLVAISVTQLLRRRRAAQLSNLDQ